MRADESEHRRAFLVDGHRDVDATLPTALVLTDRDDAPADAGGARDE